VEKVVGDGRGRGWESLGARVVRLLVEEAGGDADASGWPSVVGGVEGLVSILFWTVRESVVEAAGAEGLSGGAL